jgi:hypothetical protein
MAHGEEMGYKMRHIAEDGLRRADDALAPRCVHLSRSKPGGLEVFTAALGGCKTVRLTVRSLENCTKMMMKGCRETTRKIGKRIGKNGGGPGDLSRQRGLEAIARPSFGGKAQHRVDGKQQSTHRLTLQNNQGFSPPILKGMSRWRYCHFRNESA